MKSTFAKPSSQPKRSSQTGADCAIHVAGSSRGSAGPAGWAVVITTEGFERTLTGSARDRTANQMVLYAISEALAAVPANASGVIYTDNAYALNSIVTWMPGRMKKKVWRTAEGKPVANEALLRIVGDMASRREGIRFEWIAKDADNVAHQLARRRASEAAAKARHWKGPIGGADEVLLACKAKDEEAEFRRHFPEGLQ